MSTETTVRARIDPEVKTQAAAALEAMGLSLSDAIRLLLVRVAADQELPFPVKVPNALTAKTLRKSARGEDVHTAKDADDLFRQLAI